MGSLIDIKAEAVWGGRNKGFLENLSIGHRMICNTAIHTEVVGIYVGPFFHGYRETPIGSVNGSWKAERSSLGENCWEGST